MYTMFKKMIYNHLWEVGTIDSSDIYIHRKEKEMIFVKVSLKLKLSQSSLLVRILFYLSITVYNGHNAIWKSKENH